MKNISIRRKFLIAFIIICSFITILSYEYFDRNEESIIFEKKFSNEKILSKEAYEQWDPMIEFDQDFMEGSILHEDEEMLKNYMAINYLYRKAFEEYLFKELELENFNNILENSRTTNNKSEIIYKKYSTLNNSSIFLRSFAYIERLSDKDLKILNQKVINNDYTIDEEVMEIVNRTYMIVCVFAIEGTERYDRWAQVIGITNHSGSEYTIGGSPIDVDKDGLWLIISNEGEDTFVMREVINDLEELANQKLSCKVNVIYEYPY